MKQSFKANGKEYGNKDEFLIKYWGLNQKNYENMKVFLDGLTYDRKFKLENFGQTFEFTP